MTRFSVPETREQRWHVLRLIGQSGIVHCVDFAAGDNPVRFETHVVGDLLGHILVVAGHDDYRDAILLERFENGKYPLLGWVKESRETGQSHVFFERQRVGVLLIYLPKRDPQNAEPVGTQFLEGLRGLGLPAFVERLGRPINGHRLTDGEDTLRFAFGDEKAFVAMPHHHRKALAARVEGNLIQLLVFDDQGALVFQNRGVQRTLDPRLKKAVQVDEPQDAIIVLPLDVQLHRPKRWQIAFIRQFMMIIGPISSIYDFLTFAVLLWMFHASTNAPLFHTGWFVESLATQTLVVFVIRTAGNPLKSRPGGPLLLAAFAIVAVAVALPYTGLGKLLQFTPLPLSLLATIALLAATYLLLVQVVKSWFYRRHALL